MVIHYRSICEYIGCVVQVWRTDGSMYVCLAAEHLVADTSAFNIQCQEEDIKLA